MKRLILLVVMVVGLIVLNQTPAVAVYLIDGRLEDWGLTRYTYNSNKYWFSNFDNSRPLDPRIDRKVHNNISETGNGVFGGEPYDVEALYFDDDGYYLYFAMVTSFPMIGRNSVQAGDIAIDFNGSPYTYEYGLKTKGMNSPYGLKYPSLYRNPNWYNLNGCRGNPIYITNGGTNVGPAEVYYWNATYDPDYPGYLREPLTSPYYPYTWILEGRIDRFLFDPVPQEGDSIRLHWSMSCGNDYINLDGNFDSPPIPEPTSFILLGTGLLSLAGLNLKKFRRKG